MSAHTPGPWAADGLRFVRQVEALIAAAPELLEALRVARDHINMGALEISHCKDAALIRAAIVKATGERNGL
jgi:hypothetical protein